jgi:hypothetical protein
MKSTKLITLSLLSAMLFLASCSTSKKTNTSGSSSSKQEAKKEEVREEQIVGNDSDDHGCKASAGYTYSSLQAKCIRLFEQGIRLDPKLPELNQSVSAFVIFKSLDENQEAEVFLPSTDASMLFIKTGGENEWLFEGMNLKQNNKTFSLFAANGDLMYEGIDKR